MLRVYLAAGVTAWHGWSLTERNYQCGSLTSFVRAFRAYRTRRSACRLQGTFVLVNGGHYITRECAPDVSGVAGTCDRKRFANLVLRKWGHIGSVH